MVRKKSTKRRLLPTKRTKWLYLLPTIKDRNTNLESLKTMTIIHAYLKHSYNMYCESLNLLKKICIYNLKKISSTEYCGLINIR